MKTKTQRKWKDDIKEWTNLGWTELNMKVKAEKTFRERQLKALSLVELAHRDSDSLMFWSVVCE